MLHLCAGRTTPRRLRVDAIPSLATSSGTIGEALAGSILDGAPDGGRRVSHGQLVRAPVAGARQQITTPDGRTVTTASLPTGDLLAAWRATGAESVISATSAIPSGPLIRATFPILSLALRPRMLRHAAIRALARVHIREAHRPEEFSWGRATAIWDDGTAGTVWLRLGDAQDFTEQVSAEVARRLLKPVTAGAHTPGALFGAALATDLGAVLLTL